MTPTLKLLKLQIKFRWQGLCFSKSAIKHSKLTAAVVAIKELQRPSHRPPSLEGREKSSLPQVRAKSGSYVT